MPFLSAIYANFRNIQDGVIDFSFPEVFLVGENGQGKSNILESLYMTAYGASFKAKSDVEIARFGTKSFSVKAIFKNDKERTESILYLYSEKKKRIERNLKPISDRKELVSAIPCILFNHDDMDFVEGSPERKRFFIDQSLSMHDSEYIDTLRKYKKILKARGALLKSIREGENTASTLDIIDIQLAHEGLNVIKKRKSAVWNFNWIFPKLYEEAGGIKGVSIGYESSWKWNTAEEVAAFLFSKREADIALGTSLSGPHRDKITFLTESGANFALTASMGQKRLLALLLRVSQAVFYTRQTGKLPILLMDDVLLELDPEKRKRFTASLPEYDQLFCTFLPGEPYSAYAKTKTMVYTVREGKLLE